MSDGAVVRAVGRSLGRHVELSRLVSDAVAAVATAIGAERGTFFLREPGTGHLVAVAGHFPELPELRLAPGQGIAGHVVATGESLLLADVAADPRFSSAIDAAAGFRARSIACVPVRDDRDRIIGALQMRNLGRAAFHEDDELELRALAGQLAMVLEATSLLGRVEAPCPGPVRCRYDGIVGECTAMRQLYDLVARAAVTDATVLVTGETGTGKGIVARAIHDNGARASRPFVAIDCASLPASLLESELFGHERGAFTGAERRGIGKLEHGHGGTVFLDEVGELPLAVQGTLLRVLQERRFERVGGTQSMDIDVRIIAATNRDLEAMVARGAFREDLYHRLRVLPLVVPPLRARGSADLELLVHHFSRRASRRLGRPQLQLSEGALACLLAHDWPGNVRELEHCLEGAAVLAPGDVIRAGDLPLPPRTRSVGARDADLGRLTWQQMEKRYVSAVLAEHEGNRSAAAKAMGIARATLVRKIRTLGI
jgi:transcriptional regulator with GAF, ATPase, and Fis domain